MNDKNSKSLFSLYDVPAAFALLSRIPMPFDYQKLGTRGANAVWAYPIVGAAIGAIAGALIFALAATPIPSSLTALVGLTVLVMLTGAMHEDGLADCADGFWGGGTIKRRLEIMKDSRIGAFGVIALILVLVAEWSLIEGLIYADPILLFAAVGAMSRVPICVAMQIMPNARKTGLSALTGRPKPPSTTFAVLIGIAFVVLLIGANLDALLLIIGSFVGAILVFLFARIKLRGQTGDVLGASQKLATIFALGALYLA